MAIAQHGALLRDLIVERRALRAQHGEEVLFQRAFDVGLEVALRLLVAGLCLLGAQAGDGNLLGQVGDAELLRGAVTSGTDDLVVAPECGDRILGYPEPIAECLEAAVEPAGGVVGRDGAGLALVSHECFGDRVGV